MQSQAAQLITSSTRFSDRPRVVNPLKLQARFSEIVAGIARSQKILILSGDAALAGTGLPPLNSPAAHHSSDLPRVPLLKARFSEIVAGIARSQKILILSGDAALAGTGLPPLNSPAAHHSSDLPRVPLHSLIRETVMERPETLPASRLAIYNCAMAERRIAARQANRNCFLDFLDRLETIALDEVMLSRSSAPCNDCTASFKKSNKQRRTGNEATRSLRPAVQHHISLSFTPVDVPIDHDDEDEYVHQPDAVSSAGSSKDATGAGGKVPNKSARPKRKPPIELPETDQATITKFHRGSKLLLILGAQPKDPGLLNLVRDLAMSVHEGYGAVVYIDPVALHGVQHDHIDIQLQADVQETLGEVLLQMQHQRLGEDGMEAAAVDEDFWYDQRLGEDGMEAAAVDEDFWYDLIENDIPARFTEKEKQYDGDLCSHCGCGITDYLAQCTTCLDHYCYRRVQHQDSDDEDSDAENLEPKQSLSASLQAREVVASSGDLVNPAAAILPQNNARTGFGAKQIIDTFPHHDACIGFNVLSPLSQRPPLAEAVRSFVCPACWSHRERGLYPHYVRPIARESVELKSSAWPRMAMVVYYVEEFWPQTKHLISLIAGRWKQLGWECVVEPVKLQHLDEKEDVFRDLPWEKGTYQVVAVYITHGLEGQKGYQLNNSQALRPAEFMIQTLRIVRNVIEGASLSTVFIFGCGHPLHQPLLVQELYADETPHKPHSWPLETTRCVVEPVKLQHLDEKEDVFRDLPWEKGTYQVVAVYITHGLEGQKGYQLNNSQALRPAEFMIQTLRIVRKVIEGASLSTVFIFGCGHPLHQPLLVQELHEWMNHKSTPSILIGCMNKKLAPVYMFPFFSKISQALADESEEPAQLDGGQGEIEKRDRKIWRVKHDGRVGSKLSEIKVEATCRACRQTWVLPQETMQGVLIKVNGEHGAIVPYFREERK
ncbi:hypothetical protein RSAG8_09744, partial [Rhizoctonia solani AG-8 WAC10335]